jgi:hypothetical protein
LGREIAPGRITFPSSKETSPRLRALFSSLFVMEDASQSPGLVTATEVGGAGGAGVGGGASGALLFGRDEEALAAAPPLAELAAAAAARFFFFTIAGSVEDLRTVVAAQRL